MATCRGRSRILKSASRSVGVDQVMIDPCARIAGAGIFTLRSARPGRGRDASGLDEHIVEAALLHDGLDAFHEVLAHGAKQRRRWRARSRLRRSFPRSAPRMPILPTALIMTANLYPWFVCLGCI